MQRPGSAEDGGRRRGCRRWDRSFAPAHRPRSALGRRHRDPRRGRAPKSSGWRLSRPGGRRGKDVFLLGRTAVSPHTHTHSPFFLEREFCGFGFFPHQG